MSRASRFEGSFTQQEPIPEAGITAVVDILKSGRLHRYNLAEGEEGAVAQLETAYARWQGVRHCLAVTSGGQAMQIALRAIGVGPGDPVLSNAFTLAPVPGAIAALGARAILVESDEALRLDLDDLARKADASGARVLLLSHMRGHLCDMDRLTGICERVGLTLIEDCAHTMGALWAGRKSGSFGKAACFSTQTYKHLNSGEGGLLCTDDPEVAARATILSGSYMNHARHGAGPEEDAFRDARLDMPNCSARMDAVRAALLLAQLPQLDGRIARWETLCAAMADGLERSRDIVLPRGDPRAQRVGSSIQFRLPGADPAKCEVLVERCANRGVDLKWFGRAEPYGFTSAHGSWRYLGPQLLPRTDRTLSTLFDMRLPLTFDVDDCTLIAEIVVDEVDGLDL